MDVLPARSTEPFVEASDGIEVGPPVEDVAGLEKACRVDLHHAGKRLCRPFDLVGGWRGAADDDPGPAVLGSQARAQPVRVRSAVIIGKRHHRRPGGAPPEIAGGGRSAAFRMMEDLQMERGLSSQRLEHLDRVVRRCIVDEEDLELVFRERLGLESGDQGFEAVSTAVGGDHYRNRRSVARLARFARFNRASKNTWITDEREWSQSEVGLQPGSPIRGLVLSRAGPGDDGTRGAGEHLDTLVNQTAARTERVAGEGAKVGDLEGDASIAEAAGSRCTTNVPHHGSGLEADLDRKSTRLNSSHAHISYAGFCLK